jgi:membrane-bound lytic murein transglycosylase D
MTPPIRFAIVTIARSACILSVLAGCATVKQDSGRSPSLAPSLRGLQTVDTDAASPAGKTRPPKPYANLKSSPATAGDGGLPSIEISAPQLFPQTIDLTSETDDLFERMRNGFSMPDINNDLVLSHQQWYLSRPDYLRRMVERGNLYLHHIVEELDKRGMPMELALLPMVESAYNPMAFSRSKASGLWQFIPTTGKRYNLDQNWWKDERRDVVASTAAALDYLQSIYEMHGDWHLALASYNWGEGAVGRAVSKNRAQGLPTDYLSLTMPGETKNYVPKLQALKNIFSNPALVAELHLPRIPNRPYFATVTKMANIDVKLAAKLAEMPVPDFVALNPAHNRPVIQSETPMVIPADKLDTFVSNLEAHEGSNKPLSSWQPYTVRPGDKLEKIAPRFGMTVANLKAANGISGQIKVNPGFTLLVGGHEGGEPLNVNALPEQPRLAEAEPVPETVANSHTVRKGESLPMIARRYGTSVAELKRTNHLKTDRIAAGTRLTLAPVKTLAASKITSGKVAAVASAKQQAGAKQKPPKIAHYTVRRGDTLTSIAKQFKVALDDLLRWNRISPNTLTPGKTLTIELTQNI